MRLGLTVLACVAVLAAAGGARAQLGDLASLGGKQPVRNDEPVTFTADSVEYDRDRGLVSATGSVEAWQNGHVLRADRVTFDRTTNVAAAYGHVVLLEPDGQVLFADYAELTQGMKEGVLSGMRGLLAQNGRLAANGARRTGGLLNEFSKVVYSTCNVCADNPDKPPFWQLSAESAVQDKEHQRIEYTNATMEMFGIPVAYFPYFSNPDPSTKRQSGFLIPSIGSSSHIGSFVAAPYYLVLDDQSDVTITPLYATQAGAQVDFDYRRRFNDGTLAVNGSIGQLNHKTEGSVFGTGAFDFDETWRYGFTVDRASTVDYLRDFSLGRYLGGTPDVLTSNAFIEGFGVGAYARLDTVFYQSLTTSILNSETPTVLPRFTYSYFGALDQLGGRFSANVGGFNILRSVGTDTRRANLSAQYDLALRGDLGELWALTLHADAAAYSFDHLAEQPNFGTRGDGSGTAQRALPQAALMVRWPFVRDGGTWGQQVLEPIAQVITAPNTGDSQFRRYPNEDSFDLDFTDANLFSLNRFPGIDRLEGGTRANVALHGAWYLNGTVLDGLVGQSYQTEVLPDIPAKSGLNHHTSDIVARATFAPTDWFDVTYRTRLDKDTYQIRVADLIATVGTPLLTVGGGYIRTSTDPYLLYQNPPTAQSTDVYFPRDEATMNVSSKFDEYKLSGFARRDLANNRMVSVGATAAFENECYIFDVTGYKRYTSINNDTGSTTVLFQMTFKTIGQFGFHAF